MAQLTVRVKVADRRPDDVGSLVRVRLLDTSQADALHPTVAEATGILEEENLEVVLDVPDDAVNDRHRFSVFAHVDHEGDGSMHPGDLITTHNVPVSLPDDVAAGPPIQATVVRI